METSGVTPYPAVSGRQECKGWPRAPASALMLATSQRTAKSVEYEVDLADGRSFRFHQSCLALWHRERASFLAP
jgi:hypothetical protein